VGSVPTCHSNWTSRAQRNVSNDLRIFGPERKVEASPMAGMRNEAKTIYFRVDSSYDVFKKLFLCEISKLIFFSHENNLFLHHNDVSKW